MFPFPVVEREWTGAWTVTRLGEGGSRRVKKISKPTMHESRPLAHIDVRRKAAVQFSQIHCGNSIVPDVCRHAVMKFLILLCVLAPICASELILDGDGWLMQDLRESFSGSIRVRRQVPHGAQRTQAPQEPQYQYRPYSQAPSQIKQLLQLQQQRSPVVPIPSHPPPSLGSPQRAEPQVQSQAQATGSYRPNVQYGNAPQQPTYRNQAAAVAAQYQPRGQQQQYQPQGQSQYNQQQYQHQG